MIICTCFLDCFFFFLLFSTLFGRLVHMHGLQPCRCFLHLIFHKELFELSLPRSFTSNVFPNASRLGLETHKARRVSRGVRTRASAAKVGNATNSSCRVVMLLAGRTDVGFGYFCFQGASWVYQFLFPRYPRGGVSLTSPAVKVCAVLCMQPSTLQSPDTNLHLFTPSSCEASAVASG